MTIETSFDIGSIVWLIFDNRVKKARISKIIIEITPMLHPTNKSYNDIKYYIDDNYDNFFSNSVLFKTKEELLQSL